jgi:hypothetical protein
MSPVKRRAGLEIGNSQTAPGHGWAFGLAVRVQGLALSRSWIDGLGGGKPGTAETWFGGGCPTVARGLSVSMVSWGWDYLVCMCLVSGWADRVLTGAP